MEIFRHSKSAFVKLKRVNWIGVTDTQTDTHTDPYIELRYAQLTSTKVHGQCAFPIL